MLILFKDVLAENVESNNNKNNNTNICKAHIVSIRAESEAKMIVFFIRAVNKN